MSATDSVTSVPPGPEGENHAPGTVEKIDRGLLVVATVVVLGAIMSILDTTVVNVAVNTLAAQFHTTLPTIQWVATGYTLALATVIPLTGWIADRFGTKRLYMVSIGLFVFGSSLSGLAWSTGTIILFRILQGLGGGMIMPAGMTILTRAAGPNRLGRVMSIVGVPMLLGPVIGPILGGWLVTDVSWRWIFFINLPVGALSLLMTELFVADPPYIKKPKGGIDYFGLGLLAVGIGTLQIVLDKGQREDWFQTSWIVELAVLSVVSLALLIWWELKARNAVVDLRVLLFKNFASGVTLIFVVGAALYGSLILVPLFQQELLGYTALLAGLAQSPQGVAALVCMPLVGLLVSTADTRGLLLFGLSMLSLALYMMAKWTLDSSFWDMVWPRVVFGVGMSFLFVPITTVCVAFVPSPRMGNATGIFNLMRNIGGSIGVSLMTTLLAQREQFHQTRLVERATHYSYAYQFFYGRLVEGLTLRGQSPFFAHKEALGIVYGQVQRQAMAMSFVDCFWVVMIASILTLPLVFTMTRPPKGHGPGPGAGAH